MTNASLINLTPHDITIVGPDNQPVLVIPASGSLARCKTNTVSLGNIFTDGIQIPVTTTEMGEVEGLPDKKDGTILIVSLAVAKAVPDRWDVLVPNESVRDSNGAIIGCRSLAHI